MALNCTFLGQNRLNCRRNNNVKNVSYTWYKSLTSGKRGKALKTVHCIGDQLWIHYGKPELPDLGVPDNLGFLDEKNNDETSEEEEFEKISKGQIISECSYEIIVCPK